jgi:hypothetical protein
MIIDMSTFQSSTEALGGDCDDYATYIARERLSAPRLELHTTRRQDAAIPQDLVDADIDDFLDRADGF